MGAPGRGQRRTWSVLAYGVQVGIALSLPIAFCAYAPASALTWAGVILIALLGFALLHGGLAWLVPVSGAVALTSLFWQLPVPREAFIFGGAALAFLVGVVIIRAEIVWSRDPEPEEVPVRGFGSEQVSARMVDGSIFVSWLAPTSSGGYPVLSYEVQASMDEGSTWQTIRMVPASERAVMLDDLPGGVEVSFRIAAVNAAGAGTPSRPTPPFMPMGPPGPVTGIQGHPGDGQVRLTWLAPVSNGGYPVVDYLVQASSDGGTTWADMPRQPSPECLAVIGGLANGHPYVFRVTAVNSRGRGRGSAPTQPIKPAGLPGPPFVQSFHGADRCIWVSWSPPATDGGLPLIGYVIETSHDGGASWVLTDRPDAHATSTQIGGLVNGIPYQVRISALNSVGRGPASTPSSPVAPMGVPGEVGEVRVNPTAVAYGHDEHPARPRRKRPVARALVSVVLVLAGAGLVGFAVMRTMQQDAVFQSGQSAALAPDGQPAPADGAQPSSAAPVPVPPPATATASATGAPSNASTSSSGEVAGSPLIEVPPDFGTGSSTSEVADGAPIGTLAFYRAGVPILTQSPYLVRQGVGPKVLELGPGHYPGTALPGTGGNAAIAGHRTGWGSPFLHLDQLAPGDEVVFTSTDGISSRYIVDSALVVDPNDTWVLGWDPLQAGMPTLTLTTCDPPNVNTRRLVVFARTAV